MTETKNLKLKLPDGADYADIAVLNENFGALDRAATEADIDCGFFELLGPVAAHNLTPNAHRAMAVDGNAVQPQTDPEDFAGHIISPKAHPNIVLDGNET